METRIIKIGNSKGLRLSKTILEMYDITDKVQLILKQGYIVLKPIAAPRKNWESEFKTMNENGDDAPLIDDIFEDENLEEWN